MAGTDLAKPLEDAMQSSDNLRAVIMFTDGSHNASSSVLTQAQRMRTRGIPLFIISAGSPYPLPDLALQDVKAPTYGIIGETVQIPFTIKSTLGKETRTTLIMTSRDTGKNRHPHGHHSGPKGRYPDAGSVENRKRRGGNAGTQTPGPAPGTDAQ